MAPRGSSRAPAKGTLRHRRCPGRCGHVGHRVSTITSHRSAQYAVRRGRAHPWRADRSYATRARSAHTSTHSWGHRYAHTRPSSAGPPGILPDTVTRMPGENPTAGACARTNGVLRMKSRGATEGLDCCGEDALGRLMLGWLSRTLGQRRRRNPRHLREGPDPHALRHRPSR
jgi:hypothetical protein